MMEQPLTQAQDHDRRIGQLEGIAGQLDHRLNSIEGAIAELRGDMGKWGRFIISILFGVVGLLVTVLVTILVK